MGWEKMVLATALEFFIAADKLSAADIPLTIAEAKPSAGSGSGGSNSAAATAGSTPGAAKAAAD